MRRVDVWLRSKVRIERDAHEPALAGLCDIRNLAGGRTLTRRRIHPGDAPATLAHPDLSIGPPSQIPRCVQATHDGLDAQLPGRAGWSSGAARRATRGEYNGSPRQSIQGHEADMGVHVSHRAKGVVRVARTTDGVTNSFSTMLERVRAFDLHDQCLVDKRCALCHVCAVSHFLST